MKTVNVKYIADPKRANEIVQRFLVENEEDIQKLHDNKIIGALHKEGMRKHISKGNVLIVNEKGGYCTPEGTWEIVDDIYEEATKRFDKTLRKLS